MISTTTTRTKKTISATVPEPFEPKRPAPDCPLCPRLSAFRDANRRKFPDFHNAPVDAFGSLDAALLVVGLAPGLKGANRTGRPFTGDYAGDLLYPSLVTFGFAAGRFDARPDDGLRLLNCRITNAVKCVPPENKPIGAEMRACQPFLADEFKAMHGLKAVLALGKIAHDATLRTLGLKLSAHKFAHGAVHENGGTVRLYDSYHCSRYNVNTKRLTEAMFHDVLGNIRSDLF
jgi:uracil-DNA glycosylase family 4